MILDNQEKIIQTLSRPQLYPGNVKEVIIRQSHIAILFLAGDYVYKLKRAVLSKQVDFSTPEKRRLACVQEMKRSTIYAPHLILGVKSVRELPDGRIQIGGKKGVEIDTVLVMRRFPDEVLLNKLLPDTSFDRHETMELAERLADLHTKAKSFRTKWGPDDIQRVILEHEELLSCFPEIINKRSLNALTKVSLENLRRNRLLVNLRQKSGHVRKCHGDLLLSNIAYENGEFLFFSPIEYNASLDCIDVLYDLAYLMMDLEAKGLRRLANILFNQYIAYMNDMEGFPLLPLYQSMRATERAAVCAKRSSLLTGTEKESAIKEAQMYFEMARHFMTRFKPVLIACGGLSGSGKSRIAREIGGLMNPAPGAVILRENVVKKQISGCRLNEQLDTAYNTPAVEKITYDVLYQQAKSALSVGACVIIDALFYNPKERQAVAELAKTMGVPFVGLWMDAPLSVRTERVSIRKNKIDDTHFEQELESQLSLDTGVIEWYQITTEQEKDDTTKQVIDLLNPLLELHL